jgi:hypothetical protein
MEEMSFEIIDGIEPPNEESDGTALRYAINEREHQVKDGG